jgi:long-subunit acyl-CoA synthetase (AMP-forming)
MCRQPILPGATRFQCSDCSARLQGNTFDLCETCAPKGHGNDSDGRVHQLHLQRADVKSIFVCSSLCGTLDNRFGCWGVRNFLGVRMFNKQTGNHELQWTRYDQVYRAARAVATWINAGNSDGTSRHVAIVADNCVGWVVSEVATVFAGSVSVGIHTNLLLPDMAALIEHARVSVIICDEKQLKEKLSKLQNIDSYRVLCIGSAEWEKVISMPESEWNPLYPSTNSKETIRALMYTSGSTGVPKASIIVDQQFNSEFARMSFWRPVVTFCFQPLAYMTERLIMWDMICNGGMFVIHSGNMATFFEELAEAKVSSFSAPPSIWNTLYAAYKSRVDIAVRRQGESARAVIVSVVKLVVVLKCSNLNL